MLKAPSLNIYLFKRQRRSMLLLEVLMALALVALCILPIIAPQIGIVKAQKSFMHQMELDHAVHLLYVDVLEKLYTNKINWNEIEQQTASSINREMIPEKYEGTYHFQIVKHKKDKTEEWQVYLIKLVFTLSAKDNLKQPFSFPYTLTLVKHNKAAQTATEEPSKESEKKQPKDENKEDVDEE